jgi:hypothetical protein
MNIAGPEQTSVDITPETPSKIDFSAPTVARPGLENIPQVTDRFQEQYDKAREALTAFDTTGRSKPTSSDISRFGSSRAQGRADRRRISSPERLNLIRQQQSAERLLRGGSFADNANIRKQQRQQQAAGARSSLSQSQLFDEERAQLGPAVEALRKRKRGSQTVLDPNAVYDNLNF